MVGLILKDGLQLHARSSEYRFEHGSKPQVLKEY